MLTYESLQNERTRETRQICKQTLDTSNPPLSHPYPLPAQRVFPVSLFAEKHAYLHFWWVTFSKYEFVTLISPQTFKDIYFDYILF